MKLLWTLILGFLSNTALAQPPEQIALDFYAENLLNQRREPFVNPDKGIIVNYDQKIIPIDSQYQSIAEFIVGRYFLCKINPQYANNPKIKIAIEDIENKKLGKFIIPIPTNQDELLIPEEVKYKKRLKYKKLRGGFIRSFISRLGNNLFREKFNLKVFPYCEYEGRQYVWLKVSKKDSEFWYNYFIEITDGDVTDWCQNGWIQ